MVFAALAFSKHLFERAPLLRSTLAFGLFCALSGAVYLLNDVADVEQDRRGLKVLRVFEDSPAARGGIHRGDFILGVDGRSIAGVNSEVATNRIKGPACTSVVLRV